MTVLVIEDSRGPHIIEEEPDFTKGDLVRVVTVKGTAFGYAIVQYVDAWPDGGWVVAIGQIHIGRFVEFETRTTAWTIEAGPELADVEEFSFAMNHLHGNGMRSPISRAQLEQLRDLITRALEEL